MRARLRNVRARLGNVKARLGNVRPENARFERVRVKLRG